MPKNISTQTNAAQVDRREAEKFLKALDPKGKFSFQTFDDSPTKDRKLARVFHGTFDQHFDALAKLNKAGAGVFVTVNETDLKGRKTKNITCVRAVHVDLDGAPLEPAKDPRPHIIVESSRGRWHVYWKTENLPLYDFSNAQKAQIKRLNSDKSVHDLPRVMRLPGFYHQKGKPFRTKLVDIWKGKPYPAENFISHEKPARAKPSERRKNLPPVDVKEIEAALEALPSDDYDIWFQVGCALRKELGDEVGWPIFERWSHKSEKYKAHRRREVGRVCKRQRL